MRRNIIALLGIFGLLCLLLTVGWAAQGDGGRSLYGVFASDVAERLAGVSNVPFRGSSVLLTIITNTGARTNSVVIDGGQWVCTTNVSFPTNLQVFIAPGSSLQVTNDAMVTFHGGVDLPPGNHQVFYGPGGVTWPDMVVSNPVWWGGTGDVMVKLNGNWDFIGYVTNRFHDWMTNQAVGWQYLDTDWRDDVTMTQVSNAIAASTNMTTAFITNGQINANIALRYPDTPGSLSFIDAFMGFPYVSYATNQLSSSAAAGTALAPSQWFHFTNRLFSTFSSEATLPANAGGDVTHIFTVDLTNHYTGFIIARARLCGQPGEDISMGVAATDGDSFGLLRSVNSDGMNYQHVNTNMIVMPFRGRYVHLGLRNDGDGNNNYAIGELAIYAVTNGWTFGGL